MLILSLRSLFLSIIFLCFSWLHCGLIENTVIRTSLDKCKKVQVLRVGDKVLSFLQVHNELKFKQVQITEIKKEKTKTVVIIHTESGLLLSGKNEKFYNSKTNKWIEAKNLTINDKFFTISSKHLSIKKVEIIKLNDPVNLYQISIQDPCMFFICDSSGESILVHNLFGTIAKFFSSVFEETVEAGGKIIKLIANAPKSPDLIRAVPFVTVIAAPAIIGTGIINQMTKKEKDPVKIGDVTYANISPEMQKQINKTMVKKIKKDRTLLNQYNPE